MTEIEISAVDSELALKNAALIEYSQNEKELDSLYQTYVDIRRKRLVDNLVSMASVFPEVYEQVAKSSQYIVEMTGDVLKDFNDGVSVFSKNADGQAVAQMREAATGHLGKKLPIKEVSAASFGPAIALLAINLKLDAIQESINELQKKIDSVNQNIELDRFAVVDASREKLEQAMLFSQEEAKQMMLQQTLGELITGKHALIRQIRQKAAAFEEAVKPKDPGLLDNAAKFFKTNELTAEVAATIEGLTKSDQDEFFVKSRELLHDVGYLYEAFKLQLAILFELGEGGALLQALNQFSDQFTNRWPKELSLFIDGHLAGGGNPVSDLMMEITENTKQLEAMILKDPTAFLSQKIDPDQLVSATKIPSLLPEKSEYRDVPIIEKDLSKKVRIIHKTEVKGDIIND